MINDSNITGGAGVVNAFFKQLIEVNFSSASVEVTTVCVDDSAELHCRPALKCAIHSMRKANGFVTKLDLKLKIRCKVSYNNSTLLQTHGSYTRSHRHKSTKNG